MGFAAEIKEFIGAAKDSWKLMSDTEAKDADIKYKNVKTAETQKEMDDPLNQKLKEAKLAQMVAHTGQIGKVDPLKALQLQYWQQVLDAQKNPQITGPAAVAQPPIQRPAIAAPARESTDVEPAPLMKKGGLVKKFAIGGMVEDEDLEDELPAGVTPPAIGQPAIGQPRVTDMSAQSRPRPGAIPTPREKPRELQAVTDALKYGITQLPPPAAIGMPGGRSRALRGYAQGAGAAPTEDMLSIYKKIDPDGTMGESERNLYSMQAVHQYKLNQGDAEGAARTAFQMLQHYKTAATRYAALSAAALKGGNVDEGIKLALKAYAQVPDGNDMKLYKGKDGRIGYEMKDKDGNTISGGIATPEEIGAAAMRLATPGGFENHLVQMTSGAKIGGRTIGAGGAGAKEALDEEAGVRKPPKPADYKEIKRESIDDYVDKWNESQQLGPDGKKKSDAKALEPKELAATKDMLYHLRRNNDITENQGLQRIQTILGAADPKKGETPAFKVQENKEDKTRTILFPDGGELVVPNEQYGMFKSARLEAQEQRRKAAAQAIEDAKPGRLSKAAGAAKELLVDDPEGPGQAALAAGRAIAGPGGLGGAYEGAKAGVGAIGTELGKFGENLKRGFAVTHPGAAAAIRNPNLPADAIDPDDRPL